MNWLCSRVYWSTERWVLHASATLPVLMGRLGTAVLKCKKSYACVFCRVISECLTFYSVCQGFQHVPRFEKWSVSFFRSLVQNLAGLLMGLLLLHVKADCPLQKWRQSCHLYGRYTKELTATMHSVATNFIPTWKIYKPSSKRVKMGSGSWNQTIWELKVHGPTCPNWKRKQIGLLKSTLTSKGERVGEEQEAHGASVLGLSRPKFLQNSPDLLLFKDSAWSSIH